MSHAGTAIGRRGYRRVRRLRVAIVAAVRHGCVRRSIVQRRQHWQLVLRAIIGLLVQRRVLRHAARLAEAISMVHYKVGVVVVGILGKVLSKYARPIDVVVGVLIR
jgi:hypothetical protein